MSEASKNGRGRPRKVLDQTLESVNPVVETQKRINEEEKDLRKSLSVVDEWYSLKPATSVDGKVFYKVLHRKKKICAIDGSERFYTTYLGRHKLMMDHLNRWKAEGKLKDFKGRMELEVPQV